MTKVTRVLQLVAVAVAASLWTAGCGGSAPPAPVASSPPSSLPSSLPGSPPTEAPVTAPPAAGPTYRATSDLCATVDDAALATALGPRIGEARNHTATVGLVATATCNQGYGKSGSRVTALIQFSLATNGGSIADYYNGLRRADTGHARLTDVPGLGQGAYSWTEDTGPHLAAYDGNLYVTVSLLAGGAPVPADATPAMAETVRATLTKLGHA